MGTFSEDELRELRDKIQDELEQEHQLREERAYRKSNRHKERVQQDKERSKETEQLRNQMRLDFYKQHGYEEKIDPTGRKMYLSPAELEHKKRHRKSRTRKSKSEFLTLNNPWIMYSGIAILGVIVALLLVRSM